MKANVDKDTCIGCGLCPTIAPEVFDMDDDGKAHTIVEEVPENSKEAAKEGGGSCPVAAISVE